VTSEGKIILAIESAIAGGSLSLLAEGREIAGWAGPSDVSKAEDLLVAINDLLAQQGIARTDLGLIAVSAGPGSFTGIRIGIATALGLKTGLGVEMASESALKAMAAATSFNGKAVAAVPVGRSAVCVQPFEKYMDSVRELDVPRTMKEDEISAEIASETATLFILHGSLMPLSRDGNAVDFGINIAQAIGHICSRQGAGTVDPLFISKSF
jgi:tRNA threonylcarbamoyladenosine biosynthesis protein TsaB